ncbi:unnamed protein product [Lampetra fluviatilis]
MDPELQLVADCAPSPAGKMAVIDHAVSVAWGDSLPRSRGLRRVEDGRRRLYGLHCMSNNSWRARGNHHVRGGGRRWSGLDHVADLASAAIGHVAGPARALPQQHRPPSSAPSPQQVPVAWHPWLPLTPPSRPAAGRVT